MIWGPVDKWFLSSEEGKQSHTEIKCDTWIKGACVCMCVCVIKYGFEYEIVFIQVSFLLPWQMQTQNMFQEGLHHVFFKETPLTRPLTQVSNQGELINVRIHRWFGTVVSTRLLVTGVRRYVRVLVQTHRFLVFWAFTLPASYRVFPLRWCRSSVP